MRAKGWLAIIFVLAGCASSETYALEEYLNRIHLEDLESSLAQEDARIRAQEAKKLESSLSETPAVPNGARAKHVKSQPQPLAFVPVPVAKPVPYVKPAATRKVKVRKGDQLYRLAKRYGVSAKEVIRLNGLKRPYDLKIGQVLTLPTTRIHTVKRGEYLYQLADKYKVSLAAIVRENNLKRPYDILIGQRLVIPERLPGKASVKHFAASKQAVPSIRRESYAKQPQPRSSRPLPAVSKRSPSEFIWPVKGKVISRFGKKGKGVSNEGVNIAAPVGTKVKAAAPGVVVYTGSELKSFGNLVIIRHGGGWLTAYAHQSDIFVPKGAVVKKGQVIGRVGSSGKVKSPQLHFSIRKGKKPIDPQRMLRG